LPKTLANSSQPNTLYLYFWLTYVVVLCIAADSISFGAAYHDGASSLLFVLVAWCCYGLLYLLPAIALTSISYQISKHFMALNRLSVWTVHTIAISTAGLTTLLLYANAKIFSLYGMFINGFILNLLMTPGGIESMGGSSQSDIGFALIAAGFFVLQLLALWLSYFFCKHMQILHRMPRQIGLYTAMVIFITSLGVHFTYAADSYSKGRLTSLAETVPFFHPISARHFFKMLGYKVNKPEQIKVKGRLHYPLNPIQFKKPAKPYNIVWLVSESWRADMLDPEIMPSTWQFAEKASRFTRNDSGGNGTRMGVFSMFMGIPGNYWFSFLKEHRGAAIIDVLQQQGYQMDLFTSARFSYPEFDKTIFSQIPADKLHSLPEPGFGWERDRANVSSLLNFIDKRDPAKPFFTFMFFESPHARYHFPPESIIRRPFRDDINYATLSKNALRADIAPIKNRYINAVHHLDSQFGRIFSYLQEKNLLDNTIVVVLGDHGEEFMEHGYWGHNSTFVDEQVRTPLVIWAPGQAPRVSDEMTSHMDIIPTIMPLLGVTNPTSDYAIGYNLLSSEKRSSTYISDWNRVVYVDKEVKIVQPVSIQGYGGNRLSYANDEAIPAAKLASVTRSKQPALIQTIQDLTKFLDKKPPPR